MLPEIVELANVVGPPTPHWIQPPPPPLSEELPEIVDAVTVTGASISLPHSCTPPPPDVAVFPAIVELETLTPW